MSLHSPAPWFLARYNDGKCSGRIFAADGMSVAMVRVKYRLDQSAMVRDEEKMTANSLLITAAPELLHALEEAAKKFDEIYASGGVGEYFELHDVEPVVRAAIAKARGES
jgi:putative intracellular protease/amidase